MDTDNTGMIVLDGNDKQIVSIGYTDDITIDTMEASVNDALTNILLAQDHDPDSVYYAIVQSGDLSFEIRNVKEHNKIARLKNLIRLLDEIDSILITETFDNGEKYTKAFEDIDDTFQDMLPHIADMRKLLGMNRESTNVSLHYTAGEECTIERGEFSRMYNPVSNASMIRIARLIDSHSNKLRCENIGGNLSFEIQWKTGE